MRLFWTISSIVTGMATLAWAADVRYAVVAFPKQGETVGVSVGQQIYPLSDSEHANVFVGTAPAGDNYQYVISNNQAKQFEANLRKLNKDTTSTGNEFFNRSQTVYPVPDLPQAYNPIYPPLFSNMNLSNEVATLIVQANMTGLNAILANPLEKNKYIQVSQMLYVNSKEIYPFTDAGLKNSGQSTKEFAKQSYKIALNKFAKKGTQQKQLLFGRTAFKLRAEESDPTFVREKLLMDCLAASGAATLSGSWTRLFINGEPFGLYLMIDTSSTHFIDAVLHGGNADAHTGPMYKGNALSDTEEANLVYLGDDPKLYTKDVYKLEDKGTDKALQKNDSLGPLIQFTRLLQSIDPSQATDAQHQGNLSTLIDPQHTLLHLAMNFLSGSWDGLWFQASNYYLTQDNTQTNHWTVVTYDFDETFGIDPESKPLLNISYQNFGKPNAKRPLVDALLRSPYWQSQFEQVLKTLIKRFFKPSAIEPRLQAWKAMLQQDISWDRSLQPRSPGTKTTWTESDFEKNMDSALNNDAMGLMEWIKARSAATCQQLQINDNDDLPALGPYSGGNHWNQGAENNGANPAADKPKNAAAAITLSQQNAISVFVMTTILVLFQSM